MAPPRMYLFAWPGLARLWGPGQGRGLAVALVFSILLNAALLTTWGGIGELGFWGRTLVWGAVGIFWSVSAWNSHCWRLQQARLPKKEDCDRLFAQAQQAYLRGNWAEVEGVLRGLLEARADDVEARLLLATLHRRTGRDELAREQLEGLTRRDGAARWSLEIGREWELIERERRETPAAA